MKRTISSLLTLILIINLGLIPVFSVSGTSAGITNLFDPAASTLGWVNGSGETSPDGGFHTSAAISVSAGDVMYFGAAVTGQGWHLVTLDADKKATGTGTLSSGITIEEQLDDITSIMKYTVPAGTSYLRFVCDTRYMNVYIVTKNEILTEDIYREVTNTEKPDTGEFDFNVDPNSPLIDKSALFCGDSISYGQWDITTGYGGWATRIGEAYNMQVSNPSVGGTSVSTIRSGRIIDQINKMKTNTYDYVILQGGVNDAWGDGTNYAAPGTISDSYNVADFDISTYAGGLEELFYYTNKYFPDAIIGYIITFATPGAVGIGHTTDMEDYYSEAIKICDKWGVQYLDLYHDPYVSNTLMKVTKSDYLRDPIHPNAAGYNRLSPYISKWMETLVENNIIKENKMYNKKALFCGDSISYGSSDSVGGRAWAGRIGDSFNMVVDNQSKSGWSLSTARGARIIEQLKAKKGTLYDYVILHGGVNDAWESASPGIITDSFDVAGFDITTYAGALEELFYYATKYYPAAKIGYIINFATPNATTIGRLTDMEPYYSVGIAICEKWNIQYLDLYHDDYVNNTLLQVTKNLYMADAVHPNSAGYERLAPYIGEWMKKLEQRSDVKAAKPVINKISVLPETVTINDETTVIEARTAYDALTYIQKALINNIAVLTAAEKTISDIKYPVVFGDVNGNDGVTASDALLTLQASVKKITLNEQQTKAADVDGNEGVTAGDALLILQKSVKKIDKFPIETE